MSHKLSIFSSYILVKITRQNYSLQNFVLVFTKHAKGVSAQWLYHPPFGILFCKWIDCGSRTFFLYESAHSGGKKHLGPSAKTVADVLSLLRNIFRYGTARGIELQCSAKEVTIRQHSYEFFVSSIHEPEQLCKYLCSVCPVHLPPILQSKVLNENRSPKTTHGAHIINIIIICAPC